jgi:molybdate transport system permease protein
MGLLCLTEGRLMIVEALWVSLQVTAMAAVGILLVGLPLALYLARSRRWLRHLVGLLILLPMLLPPTVVGFFLLSLLGRGSPLVEVLGIHLLFTVHGAAAAATVVGLPMMILPSRAAIMAVDRRLEDVARTLGAGELEVLLDVTLPLAGKGIAAGMLLGIARATGEFGATLMVAGSIPGRTRTLSLALYESIQMGDNLTAFGIVVLLTSIILLVIVALRFLESDLVRWTS